ncbi:thiamine diphosphokinase [Anaerosalibacter massiliensis]|uniref:Thiamine diphosphokinase n=1 Tax=Anaerosalibacter massiliensis TaxID=1347392 RepID=A0A9X2MF70_9FIRM|nr:thiamine diphosphokinase [Anaerosalibacter massiliensis]MCR2042579.1 thiamine diphosphokinase [Anaerosalibacter massiliensis]
MKSLVVSNGEINDLNQLKSISKEMDFIIAVDGGAKYILKSDIQPDLVVGDLDSIDKDILKEIKEKNIPILKYPSHKDYTDTELALKYLIDKGFKEIVLMGVIGSRIDHTLANIFLLSELLNQGVKGIIINEKNTMHIIDDEMEIKKEDGVFISVLPINSDGAKVTLKGFEYETDRVDFNFSSTLGVSNRIIEEKGYIKVENGICLIIESRD